MKKTTKFLGAVLALIMVSCSGEYKEKLAMDSLRIAELTSQYNEAATFNDSLMLLMGDIYNGLDSINMQEGLLYNMASTGEGYDRRAQVRNNLSAIKARLKANQDLLSQMEKRMKAQGNETAVMTKTIDQLKQRLEQQDTRIAALENQLELANDSILNLNRQVAAAQMQAQIQTEAKDAAWSAYEQADQALNTVYYAMGTTKDLKENHLLEKKFLRSAKVMEGDFNQEYFTKADKRVLTSIPTGAKKINILTNQPKDSYTEEKNADGMITLKITNPDEFWKVSPYLLIELK